MAEGGRRPRGDMITSPTGRHSNTEILTRLMLRLLPVQVVLAAVATINGFASSIFASNALGVDGMSVMGLYTPVVLLTTAAAVMLSGGASILLGKHMGRNDHDRVENFYSLHMLISVLISLALIAVFLPMAAFDLTGIFTQDRAIRPLFNRFMMGELVGVLPFILGNQLPVYLALQNRQGRTMTATLISVGVNVALKVLFVQVMHMGTFGLGLASSLGLWAFFLVQAEVFLRGRSGLHFRARGLRWAETGQILLTGLPGAASQGYQALRGILLNGILGACVGTVGVSAFATVNNLLGIFWAVPVGMAAVSRLLIGLTVGEEDRQTLEDIMRTMFRVYIPMVCLMAVAIMLLAEPLTRCFFRDSTEPVYQMTIWGFRIVPLCMPMALIKDHFICYGQASGKRGLVHLLAALDGVVCMVAFSAVAVPLMGIHGAYWANIFNGLACLLVILLYARLKVGRFPQNLGELMVIPRDFGVAEEARIDISIRDMAGVMEVSREVAAFARGRGIDERRVYLASLCLEEMAGNIVSHGFTKDAKPHSVDIRVVHKDDDLILRIRDDCVPFDPAARRELTDPGDLMKNIGIRMVFKVAQSVEYQNLMGLNVLTVRI